MAGGDDALASSTSASLLDAEDDDLDMESEPAAPTRQQSQEAVLSGLLPKLHSLMQLDSDVDMGALLTCLGSANSLYCHMIKEHMSDVGAQVFLMYDSFYQPLMREALLPALQQLLNSERQVQLVDLHNAGEYRTALQQFVSFVARYLSLQLRVFQGQEFQPCISQRVGEDLAPMLRGLAMLFDDSHLSRCRPFHAEHPAAAARGSGELRLGEWAAVEAAAGGGGGEEGGEEPPQTPALQQAAAASRAAFVDLFGALGGWEMLLQLLCQPELLGDYLWAFLQPLAAAAPLMLPARRPALRQAADAVVAYLGAAFAAAPDLSAVEGAAANPEQRLARVLLLTRSLLASVTSPEAAAQEVGPLQREHVLCLLRAPSFTRQLAGVKQLRELLWFTFCRSALEPDMQAFAAWLQEHDVVLLMLRSNLHQAQYAEQAQYVLGVLLQHGALSEEAIAFLWQLTEDATTFEAVKSNAYAILASLGPHMRPAQLAQLFERLQVRAAASGVNEALSICGLLVGMAQRDAKGAMRQGTLDCLLAIQLRRDAPREVAGSHAIAELCATYDGLVGHGASGLAAAQACVDALGGEAAAPAAAVLHTLLTQLWHKPERMRAAMQQLNPDAALLKRCLECHAGWLRRQRAKLPPDAPAGPAALHEGPPAGAFSHRDATDAWHRLLRAVIYHGLFFLLTEQVEQMVEWATELAVTRYDSDKAWDLATAMVASRRKEVMEKVAADVLTNCLCQLPPGAFTLAAWRCFLAHLCALSEWDVELLPEDITLQLAVVTPHNQEVVRGFLWRLALEAQEPFVSRSAATLLARTVAVHMRHLPDRERGAWQRLLAAEVQRCLERLRADAGARGAAADAGGGGGGGGGAGAAAEAPSWSSPPTLELGGGEGASWASQRILRYLVLLVEECQGKRMPSPAAHRCSWRGFPLTLTLQLPPQQGHKAYKQELVLPDNLPVGQLRRTVAEWLGRPPQYVRLLGGGREFDNDGQPLGESRAAQQVVMASLNQKANRHSGRNVAEEEAARAAAEALVQQPDAFALILAMLQAPPPAAEAGAAPPPPQQPSEASTALQLLGALPTCPAALRDLRGALAAADGGAALRALLAGGGAAPAGAAAQPGVLMYALQCTCALLFPSIASSAAGDPGQGGAEAAELGGEPEALRLRLLRSGALAVLLDAATGLAAAATPPTPPPTHPEVAAAAHRAMLLLLHHLLAAAEEEEAAAAAAAAGPSATAEVSAGMAAAQLSEPASMQVDSGAGQSSDAAAGSAASEADGGDGEVAAAAAAAPAALRALAPAAARYCVAMLCSALGCSAEQQQGQPGGVPAGGAAAAQPAVDPAALPELCRQALELLRRLAAASHGAVQALLGARSGALRAAVGALLLHPASAPLRRLAADWLPRFAAAAPPVHRWAFAHVVRPLLARGGGGSGEQMALCSHFVDTLEESEFPAARELLRVLLQRLSGAIERAEPIDGLAAVVGSLIRRLDCREVGMTHHLAAALLHGCCFPALSLLRQREALALSAMAAAAGAPAGAPPPPPADLAAADAAAERCVAASRAQHAQHAVGSSREAAFDLLLDLAVHDSGCWQYVQDQLATGVHAAAAALLPQLFNNVPLQALRAPESFAGLQNGGATCYMSSVFQQLFMQPTVRRLVLSAPSVPLEEQQDSLFHQVQVMFAHLALGVEPWFEPRGFWRAFKDYDGQPVNIREHQDAYEFFTRLQDSVDEHLRAAGRPRAIHAALGGAFAQVITVIGAPEHRSEREEEFYQISLDVRGKRTLAESLDSYVSKELMDGQNQYHCEELGKKVDAEKRTLLKALPHTLALHLKRFEWDYETYQRWKVKDRFEFPLELDLYPYTVEAADEADGRESAGKRDRGHYLYRLCGVVVHSGSAFAGHYYSYIKDREHGTADKERWYCFDDTSVEPWDPASLDKDCFGGRFVPEGLTQECDRPNSAYMLFYEQQSAAAQPRAAAAAEPARRAEQAQPAAAAAGGEQPMALSPAPSAEPPAGPAPPYGMPRGLFDSLLVSNLRQLGMQQLLSADYCRFMWQLVHLLGEAVATGTTRKAAKREPTSSPGGGDAGGGAGAGAPQRSCQLAALTSRRGSDLAGVTAEAAVLCLDYILRVALRGGQEVRREALGAHGRRPAPGMAAVLREATRTVPQAAAAVLLHMASGPGAAAADALLTRHSVAGPRKFVQELTAAAADCLACQEHRTEEAVHALRSCVDHLCAELLPSLLQAQTGWQDEQLLALLQSLAAPRHAWRRALMDPHLDPLLDLVRRVVEPWNAQDSFERPDPTVGNSALCLLGSLLRRFSTDAAAAERSRRKPPRQGEGGERPLRNQYGLEGCQPVPMPPSVEEWLYGDPTFPRRLLLSGCLYNKGTMRLLAFLMYDDTRHAQLWSRALLDHVLLDTTDWRDLAADLETVANLVTLKDGLYEQRMLAFFAGKRFFKEMTSSRHGVGCQHLRLALVLQILSDAPDVLASKVLMQGCAWMNWAADFLHRRQARQVACERDDSALPDSPTCAELSVESKYLEEVLDVHTMWQLLEDLQLLDGDGPAAAAAADDDPAAPARSGSTTSSGGGGGGRPAQQGQQAQQRISAQQEEDAEVVEIEV